MSTDLATVPIDAATVARVLLHGDLRQLTDAQRISYYRSVCDSVGLNPLTQPFAYLVLNGKEILYAKREATEQLRRIHTVSIVIASRELVGESYIVSARATMPDGRTDESIGVKSLDGLKGDIRGNAMMTAETKAKRRVTLSICGLGMLDETEVADIPMSAKGEPDRLPATVVDLETGTEVPLAEAPAPPAGYYYVGKYEKRGAWHEAHLLNFFDGERSLPVSTKRDYIGVELARAQGDGIPVKVELGEKPGHPDGDEAYVNKVTAWKPPPPVVAPLSADDIPF